MTGHRLVHKPLPCPFCDYEEKPFRGGGNNRKLWLQHEGLAGHILCDHVPDDALRPFSWVCWCKQEFATVRDFAQHIQTSGGYVAHATLHMAGER